VGLKDRWAFLNLGNYPAFSQERGETVGLEVWSRRIVSLVQILHQIGVPHNFWHINRFQKIPTRGIFWVQDVRFGPKGDKFPKLVWGHFEMVFGEQQCFRGSTKRLLL